MVMHLAKWVIHNFGQVLVSCLDDADRPVVVESGVGAASLVEYYHGFPSRIDVDILLVEFHLLGQSL